MKITTVCIFIKMIKTFEAFFFSVCSDIDNFPQFIVSIKIKWSETELQFSIEWKIFFEIIAAHMNFLCWPLKIYDEKIDHEIFSTHGAFSPTDLLYFFCSARTITQPIHRLAELHFMTRSPMWTLSIARWVTMSWLAKVFLY